MSKFFKGAELVAKICGGWWSLMSGAISVPFALIGLLWGESHAKEIFIILAFVSLWVFVLRTVWTNYKLIEKTSLKELLERENIAQRSHIILLEAQVLELSDNDAKREQSDKVKKGKQQLLSNCATQLEMQSIAVGNIGSWFYKDEAKAKACVDTDEIVNRITNLLDTFFDPISATRFSSAKADQIPCPAIADIHTQQHVDLATHISYLENHKKELLEIGKLI